MNRDGLAPSKVNKIPEYVEELFTELWMAEEQKMPAIRKLLISAIPIHLIHQSHVVISSLIPSEGVFHWSTQFLWCVDAGTASKTSAEGHIQTGMATPHTQATKRSRPSSAPLSSFRRSFQTAFVKTIIKLKFRNRMWAVTWKPCKSAWRMHPLISPA